MNWTWYTDGQHPEGGVEETADPVDGTEVFATFTEARAALTDWFRYMAATYADGERQARRLRRADGGGGVRGIDPRNRKILSLLESSQAID